MWQPIEELGKLRSDPTVKQHLTCIRMLFDHLATGIKAAICNHSFRAIGIIDYIMATTSPRRRDSQGIPTSKPRSAMTGEFQRDFSKVDVPDKMGHYEERVKVSQRKSQLEWSWPSPFYAGDQPCD